MPVYEFICLDCRKSFSEVMSISAYESTRVECPKCGSKKVERRWSSVFVETSKKS